jgi:hypothetical protein
MSYPIFESKEERNAWVKERRAKNVNGYGTNNNIGTALLSSLKAKYAYKNTRYVDVHAATVQQIYNHLESQFTDGMNWENRGTKPDGSKGWQIDHRKPKYKFLCGKKEELYKCWHWTNLQPMWAEDNYEKGCYFDPDTFEYEWKGREIGWSHKIHGEMKKNEEINIPSQNKETAARLRMTKFKKRRNLFYEDGIFDRDGVEISDVDDYDSAEEFNQF